MCVHGMDKSSLAESLAEEERINVDKSTLTELLCES